MSDQLQSHAHEEGQASVDPLPLPRAAEAMAAIPAVSTAELTTLFTFSPDALILVDQEGNIVQVNTLTSSLFGYHPDELTGLSLELLLPERFRAVHRDHRASYAAEPHQRPMGVGLNLVGRRKDGSEFPVDISLRPVLLEQRFHVVGAIRDVTTQRLLERERVQQAERLAHQATLLHLAHDAIVVRDPISRILSWNRGAEELYGWSEQEALGRISHTLLKTRFPVSQAAVTTQLEEHGQWEGELVYTRRNGRIVVVESHQILLRDEQGVPTTILEINRDITARRQQEHAQTVAHAEMLREHAFLQELLDALPNGITVVHGHEARLLLTNRAAASIWGSIWPIGQPMREFVETRQIRILDPQGRECPPHTWATMRALLSREVVLQHQENIRQPSGNSIPILVSAVPLISSHWPRPREQSGSGGEVVSARGETQREGEPLALIIYQNVQVLKEAEYLKDEFIGIAAHELRLPLAVLKGSVGTLVLQTARGHGTPLADWQQEMLQELEQATDRLAELTDELLDVSRLQAGQSLLQPAATNLVSLVQRVVARFQKTTTRHHLTFQTEQQTLEVVIDPRRIEQVLTNLLTNAIKYSPQGGPIEVALEQGVGTSTVEIRVQDHGIGIPLHQQGQIFGRFVRADNAQAAGISGTGLGLYLSRAFVEQHGGHLWFASTEGEGTTFFLTLPQEHREE